MSDWGKGLGSDPEQPIMKVSESARKTKLGLMHHYKHSIPFKMSGEVNGPAMMKCFTTLRDNGVSYDDIYKMIDKFFTDLKEKPLASNIPTWKVFIQKIDELTRWVTLSSPDSDVSEWK